MFNLTNYNIRRRYLEEKARARIMGEEPYTYAKMAKQFDTDDRTVYTWITKVKKLQHLPANAAKRAKLSAWINDGALEVGRK
jgi:transposase